MLMLQMGIVVANAGVHVAKAFLRTKIAVTNTHVWTWLWTEESGIMGDETSWVSQE